MGKGNLKAQTPKSKGENPQIKRQKPPITGGIPSGRCQTLAGVPGPYQEVGAGAPFPAPVLFPSRLGHHLLAGDGGHEADAREPLAGQETRLQRDPRGQPQPGRAGGPSGQEPPAPGPAGTPGPAWGN